MQRSYYPYKPVMAFPSYLAANHTIAPGQVYPVWGQQTGRPPGFPMWGSPGYPWQPAIETWHWNKPYPGVTNYSFEKSLLFFFFFLEKKGEITVTYFFLYCFF